MSFMFLKEGMDFKRLQNTALELTERVRCCLLRMSASADTVVTFNAPSLIILDHCCLLGGQISRNLYIFRTRK